MPRTSREGVEERLHVLVRADPAGVQEIAARRARARSRQAPASISLCARGPKTGSGASGTTASFAAGTPEPRGELAPRRLGDGEQASREPHRGPLLHLPERRAPACSEASAPGSRPRSGRGRRRCSARPPTGSTCRRTGRASASNRARETATPTRSRSAGGRYESADAASAGGRESATTQRLGARREARLSGRSPRRSRTRTSRPGRARRAAPNAFRAKRPYPRRLTQLVASTPILIIAPSAGCARRRAGSRPPRRTPRRRRRGGRAASRAGTRVAARPREKTFRAMRQ